MFMQKSFHREWLVIGISVIILASTAPVDGRQLEQFYFESSNAAAATKIKNNTTASTRPLKNKSAPEKTTSRSLIPAQKNAPNKITSFFIRANDSKRIQLSIIVACQQELTNTVRQLFGENVTPLLFSVATLPNRTVVFDPTLFCFEQKGRVWQPNHFKNALDILPAEENGRFGGTLTESEVHQGVILLPEWFDAQAPITLRYKEFRYLARFAHE
jgi:hypothetical protein